MRKIAFFRLNQAAFAGLALALGGCSADVARFDFGSNTAFNDQTASIPSPTAPMKSKSNLIGDDGAASPAASVPKGNYSDGGAYMPQPSGRQAPVRMTSLAEPAPPAPLSNTGNQHQGAVAAANSLSPMSPVAPSGEQIEVRPGDTLFGLSKRHSVSVAELMSTNRLSGPALKPGQKLTLPSGHSGSNPSPPSTAAAAPVASEPVTVAAVQAPLDWTGSYTVKSGDSLYALARVNKVKLDDLQRFNGITDVRKVKPGMVLKMPGSGSNSSETTTVSVTPPTSIADTKLADNTTSAATDTTTVTSSPAAAPAIPKVINAALAEKSALAATSVMTDASPAASGKMRWPVQGKIISSFGPRSDGTHNDGVNLAVPMGTDVHAAEEGTVAYAGSELKGYGNLVLIRHENGWVTAYAHSEELLVKRGDRVKRGQIIAKAGKSGSVDQPQVHFEVRQGQKPMDPAPYMEKI